MEFHVLSSDHWRCVWGTVVAANSVVTSSLPGNALAARVPARVLREDASVSVGV